MWKIAFAVAENLRPGGLFLFDVNTVYKHRQVLAGQTFVFDEEDYYLVWDNEALDDTAVRVLIDLFCYNGESYDRLSDSFIERAHTHRQLTAALSEFEILGRYAELTTDAPGRDPAGVLCLQEKGIMPWARS